MKLDVLKIYLVPLILRLEFSLFCSYKKECKSKINYITQYLDFMLQMNESWCTTIRSQEFSVKLFIIVCLFAWSSWIDINGVFVELPLLVNKSPQGWNLPSYLSVVIQLANIGPILYLFLSKCLKWRGVRVALETPVILFIVMTGAIASLLLAFTWHLTTTINGKLYSTPLILLTFVLSFVDCMSSVTFLPFMFHFPQMYITAYYVGSGMSGFLPSVVALVQGVGDDKVTCTTVIRQNLNLSASNNTQTFNQTVRNIAGNYTQIVPVYEFSAPRFSVQVFFFFISSMLVISFIAFIFLVNIKNKSEKSQHKLSDDAKHQLAATLELINMGSEDKLDIDDITNTHKSLPGVDDKQHHLPVTSLILLLVLQAIISGLSNGVIPSILSYACLPYGRHIYHLALTLSAAINPLACFIYFFFSMSSVTQISVGVLLYVACCAYTVVIALFSPCPLLLHSPIGGIISVSVTQFDE